jgi:internalin A
MSTSTSSTSSWTVYEYNTWISQGCPENTKVKSLVLSFSGISDLSADIYKLSNLECLEIRHTTIATLPSEIGMLTLLSSLDISDTKIESGKDSISNLKNLSELFISLTNISDLTPVCKLVNLEALYAAKCRITELPVEISGLKNLTLLDISSNNIGLLKSQLVPFFKQLTFLGISKLSCCKMTLQYVLQNKKQFF